MEILPKVIIDRVSIKNVKKDIGHDLCGFYCDIYLDKKKIGYLNDDGWGGEPEIIFINQKVEDSFYELLAQCDIKQFIADDYNSDERSSVRDWKTSDFNYHSSINFITERLDFLKIVEKHQKNAIVYGNIHGGKLTLIKFKKTIEEVIGQYGKDYLNGYIDKVKRDMPEFQQILNTNL